jgi:hypothetical protein
MPVWGPGHVMQPYSYKHTSLTRSHYGCHGCFTSPLRTVRPYWFPLTTPLLALIASTMSSSEHITMIPYFHFTGGDHLYFESWRPSSHAAIAGASIALFVLAISERFLHTTRGKLDARWRRRYGLHDYSH